MFWPESPILALVGAAQVARVEQHRIDHDRLVAIVVRHSEARLLRPVKLPPAPPPRAGRRSPVDLRHVLDDLVLADAHDQIAA